ncbi:solute:Na+ symporter, SSS family [Pseudarcicella hirudinis]|uniref:Solute:Na+ symporter, SSS family n=1 Tax=Pseudarcicella hirudinis TaxID=1079859 RepID=A0A1I5NS12_9BACT|nr:sodium/sugar symporter [Pseudarcicella hirudinis]SFP24467.1 solute:Na+ symporter, SSS family [Pseudarcicella hirudinis]
MQKGLQTLDYLVFLFYFIVVASYGYWIYQKKKSKEASSTDFFLAEGSLTWWAIGASLIASNISAEQFIGMAGSGFTMGLGISTYEWMAAATLMIVAIFFMPIYLKNRIFTMPQFLTQRYNSTVSTIMAVFWLILYVVVNLTSILYLGALAITTISGIDFNICMWALAFFAVVITLGGMKVIGFTDVIQVFFLILGGLATTYLALNLVSSEFGEQGAIKGMSQMLANADDHFHMIFKKSSPHYPSLPGLTVLVGGMWIVNLNYWGCNQYITQRALGADLPTAREGILFAAFLKLLMPLIVVIPGIAAYVLYSKGMFQQEMLGADGTVNGDHAYPVLLNLLPSGLKGLSFAALTAAIVASLAGKANSISTIFTLDIYRKFIKKDATEQQLVNVGRIVIVVAMILAIFISPLLGIDKKGGFQYIQEYTGYVSPGIFAVFFLGFFWKRANSAGALVATIGGVIMSFVLKYFPEQTGLYDTLLYSTFVDGEGQHIIPFLDRMGLVFLFCALSMIIIGLADPSTKNNPRGLVIDSSMFRMKTGFAIGATVILVVITILYTTFW